MLSFYAIATTATAIKMSLFSFSRWQVVGKENVKWPSIIFRRPKTTDLIMGRIAEVLSESYRATKCLGRERNV